MFIYYKLDVVQCSTVINSKYYVFLDRPFHTRQYMASLAIYIHTLYAHMCAQSIDICIYAYFFANQILQTAACDLSMSL